MGEFIVNSNVLEMPKFGHTEVWTSEEKFEDDVLNKMGKADYDVIAKAIENGETVTHRYVVEQHYKKGESVTSSSSCIHYSQMFINGINVGYYEDHPNVDLNAKPRPKTIYYDLELKTKDGKYCVKRTGSIYVWIRH